MIYNLIKVCGALCNPLQIPINSFSMLKKWEEWKRIENERNGREERTGGMREKRENGECEEWKRRENGSE